MFQLYTGNRLEDLAVLLAKILSVSPPENPFDDEYVLVQNPGMAQWLKMFLAQSHSISAGFSFPLPSTFVWQTFAQTLSDIPSQSEFNKPFLVWRLMRILDSRLGDLEFQALSWYLEDDDTQTRRFQLCSSIADIYDQYLVYRPDWIKIWESGECQDASLNALFEQQPWQAILWRDLVADISEQGTSLYHRGNLIEALQESSQSSSRLKGVPERIFIFGVSSLPPNTLESLRVLAASGWIEIHLFLQNPCRFYWGDVVDKHYFGREIKRQTLKPGLSADTLHLDANPLLASWGRLGRDYIAQLQDMADNQLEVFEDYVVASGTLENQELTSNSQKNGLLQWVQQDVLTLENHGSKEERDAHVATAEYRHLVDCDDQSIRVQLCHSPLREVEVLHDQLLQMFEQNPTLTPKDIIVMLPDVNTYSPFVKAVFGAKNSTQSKKHIPFALIDQSGGMENPIVDAYLYLLGLGESRFTLSELISVLEVPAVLARFDLTTDELERIRLWSSEVGIRWGMDGKTAQQHDLPIQESHTWLNGMRRMLLGYAMGHDHIWKGTLSYGDVEGLEASVAGKLAEFLVAIDDAQGRLMQALSPKEWVLTLYYLLERFFLVEEDDAFPASLSKHLDTLTLQWQQAHFDAPLEQQVIRQLLSPMLQESQGSQRFLAGRVNFCTLMPMRSVPFKVICVLGLNEGDYPRSVAPMGFDLMVGQYRSGDRSRREDDKYLFLEALMSARDCFYISYVGRSIQDNSEKNPSILVSELLEYIGQSCVFEGDQNLAPDEAQGALLERLIVKHPLQPFNPAYYSSSNKPFYSYDEQWLPALLSVQEEGIVSGFTPLEGLEQPRLELALDELSRFIGHPTRYFTQRRLKAYLSLREEEEREDEPFALNGLAGYQLREALLQAMLKGDEATFIERLSLTGELPYGALGRLSLQKSRSQCQQLFAALQGYSLEECEPIEVNLSLGSILLQAWLDRPTATTRLSYRIGDLSAHQKMQVWIEHLALCAQGTPKQHHLINLSKTGKLLQHGFILISPDEAKDYLGNMLTLLQQGLCQPLALPAKAADAWCKSYCSSKTEGDADTAWEQALKIYQESSSAFTSSEVDDAYWQRYFPDLSEQKDNFVAMCELIWLPMHRHLEVLE
ncbi:MAG: exodeoxyribonuclease V subunit gamma [Marinomonas sp.]